MDIQPATHFCMAHKPRLYFTFLNAEKKQKKSNILWYMKIIWNSDLCVHSFTGIESCALSYLCGCVCATEAESNSSMRLYGLQSLKYLLSGLFLGKKKIAIVYIHCWVVNCCHSFVKQFDEKNKNHNSCIKITELWIFSSPFINSFKYFSRTLNFIKNLFNYLRQKKEEQSSRPVIKMRPLH